MKETITKLIIIFELCFLGINLIGYSFNIITLRYITRNPNGMGGISYSNIPTLISLLVTIIYYVIDYNRRKDL